MIDGSVSVMTIISGTIESEIAKLPTSSDVVGYLEITEMPGDRIFRDAWKMESGELVECKVKSQALIRAKRNKKLEELDVESIQESRKPGGDTAGVEARAKTLREITADVRFNSDNINDLKKLHEEI